MNDIQGLIYTLRSEPELGELAARRNAASIPFGGRYRLIDFILSAMVNAGVRDVGVVMERDYQSLLDHLGGGKDWDLSRHTGGLRLLPPFGLPESQGYYGGCMEALRGVRSYIDHIQQEDVILSAGDIAANFDLAAAVELHRSLGAEITAVCVEAAPNFAHHRLLPDGDGYASRLRFSEGGAGEGLVSTEVYILRRSLLVRLMDYCGGEGRKHFHRDALAHYLAEGGRIALFRHTGFARRIRSVLDYYSASMELLSETTRRELFPPDGSRPVRSKGRAEVSTYYGEHAAVKNCLLSDGCYIEGTLENCILSRGVRVERGAVLRNCVVMQDAVIGQGAELRAVIADKNVRVSAGVLLAGSPRLPLIIPKGATI